MKKILCILVLIVSFSTFAFASGGDEGSGGEEKAVIRLSASASETEIRSQAILNIIKPAIADFATLDAHWNATLFKQGTELDALARGNLEMVITSAQEISQFIPEFSIFAAGYVHRDADHQIAVFNADFMDEFKKKN